jgi:hypothetical protein
MGRMPLPIYKGGTFGSGWYQLHPNGSRIAFQRHSGTVSQYWAIDNLAQFIRSGGSIAVPPDPRSR